MNSLEKDIARNLAEEIRRDVDKALDLYAAMAGRTWVWQGQEYSWTLREAARCVAEIRTAAGCPVETYRDYEGQEGLVSSWILQRTKYLGYEISSRTSAR